MRERLRPFGLGAFSEFAALLTLFRRDVREIHKGSARYTPPRRRRRKRKKR